MGSSGKIEAIRIARAYPGRRRIYQKADFWGRGYDVSTVGADEESVRDDIKKQEKEDERFNQLQLFDDDWAPSSGRFTISSYRLCPW